ncbi:MAG: hypothetical protein JSV23_01675 [Promethearchaeota archaeon]|nr:MAG: hypothetical protein JSV23_01675 [Candidatus Lokiarchaeota archaeon]
MNDIENEKRKESENSEKKKKVSKKPPKRTRKTQGQMIQEAFGLGPTDIQDVEKKLFIVRFLDYFSEETLDFIFKDTILNRYLAQITTHMENFGITREEDRLLKQSFDSKKIPEIIQKLKNEAEELAISKGVKNSMDKRLRRLTLYLTLPMFVPIIISFFFPEITYFILPVLCVFCMLPQLIRGSIVKKWLAFKEQNKNQIYSDNREDIMILKSFAGETLDNIRTRLIELKVPLQLIKFMLHSQDYDNLRLLTQKNIRGTMQYFYSFDYPPGVEPFAIPQQLMQYQQQMFPEKKTVEKMEKNFIVLSNIRAKDGIISSFIPTLKDKLAEEINEMLNNSKFSKATMDFTSILPNYSENMAIYCVCGEVVEISNIQICNWKDQFEFYLFEGKECNCGESVYALSLMDESTEIPEELKEIFQS